MEDENYKKTRKPMKLSKPWMLTAILTVLYAILGGILLLSANAKFNYLIWAAVLVLCVSVVPAFRSFLIQYSIFPAIKKLIIDPYYEQNPNADKQARRDLNLEVEEETASAPTAEDTAEDTAEEEPIFVDTLPEKEEDRFAMRASVTALVVLSHTSITCL